MLSPSSVHVDSVQVQQHALPRKPPAGPKRLRPFAAKAMWWVLSLGLVVALWELVAALQLIDPMIVPPPHLFIAEIQQQAQFLLPRVGVRRVGANFVALTAIVAPGTHATGGRHRPRPGIGPYAPREDWR